MNLSELTIGDCGTIVDFTDQEMSVKLMEMGCLPGELVKLEQVAPLGDPIAITVAGYKLSMRKQEAATILLKR
ncbi:ferrous iron transport protein A [Solitalea longa]|uniref:Ferrous iron transport protein A n=1 Tax=Solitalea longa TaxID=2079460 RepID=A0A2S5AAH8_9SPHI|nr:FeoA family protein [Solitalea longa]POY39279.1 ferrous iron transport protein A [Solitalea longa]